jgi:hypothetical protein
MTKTSGAPDRLDVKAIREPSGEYDGDSSKPAAEVSRVALAPADASLT